MAILSFRRAGGLVKKAVLRWQKKPLCDGPPDPYLFLESLENRLLMNLNAWAP